MLSYLLVFQHIQVTFNGFYPVFPTSNQFKALTKKKLLALRVGLVDGAIHLMQQQIFKKVFNAQGQRSLGIALLAVGFVDENAQAGAAVEGIVIIDVDAANGGSAFGQVGHQTELLLSGDVVVVQQKLLNLKAGIGGMCAAYPPDVAVVFPAVNLLLSCRF